MFKSKPARIAIALQFALLGLPAAYAAVQPEASANLNASGEAAMERIVVTASGFEQKVVDAPASISVISGVELQSRPYMTLSPKKLLTKPWARCRTAAPCNQNPPWETIPPLISACLRRYCQAK